MQACPPERKPHPKPALPGSGPQTVRKRFGADGEPCEYQAAPRPRDTRRTRTMSPPLENKLALVTGASGGIGSAVARRLAEDGASVLVHYGTSREAAETVVRGIRAAGGAAEAVGADLSDHGGPAALVAQLDPAFGSRFAGRLDVLVNNAGTLDFDALTEATDESFDHLFNLNVRAVFQLSREAARRMTRAGWGRIINMGSVFGEAAPLPGLSLYGATKFAV